MPQKFGAYYLHNVRTFVKNSTGLGRRRLNKRQKYRFTTEDSEWVCDGGANLNTDEYLMSELTSSPAHPHTCYGTQASRPFSNGTTLCTHLYLCHSSFPHRPVNPEPYWVCERVAKDLGPMIKLGAVVIKP